MNLGERIAVVLVEPRYPGNVGSVARVMANFGLNTLILVRPCPVDHPEARRMALDALPILRGAIIHESLEAALAGYRFAAATTCRGGKLRREAHDPRTLAAAVLGMSPENRAALVFGPEDRGLNNQELTLCRAVATIPSSSEFASLNLSHAVAVILWEMWFGGRDLPRGQSARVLAEASQVDGMYRHLEEVLLEVGFLHPENPQRMIRALKKILNRAGLEDRDVRVIRGMLRQFRWYVRKLGGKALIGLRSKEDAKERRP